MDTVLLVDDKKSQEIKGKLDGTIEKLVAVFKTEDNLSKRKRKVSNSDVSNIVDEIIKEDVEEIRKDFKAKAKELIKEKIDFDKFIEEQKAAFQKAINQKSEEFIKKSDELFKMVENIDEMKETYKKALNQ